MQQALRGRLWKLFLRLDQKKDAGVYDQLVQKALGKTKYGRRVRDCRPDPLPSLPSCHRTQSLILLLWRVLTCRWRGCTGMLRAGSAHAAAGQQLDVCADMVSCGMKCRVGLHPTKSCWRMSPVGYTAFAVREGEGRSSHRRRHGRCRQRHGHRRCHQQRERVLAGRRHCGWSRA